MADTYIDVEGVRATAKAVKASYDLLNNDIADLKGKMKEEYVKEFWDSDEADTFIADLGVVSSSFDAFSEKHTAIFESIEKMMQAVGITTDNMAGAYENFAGGTGTN